MKPIYSSVIDGNSYSHPSMNIPKTSKRSKDPKPGGKSSRGGNRKGGSVNNDDQSYAANSVGSMGNNYMFSDKSEKDESGSSTLSRKRSPLIAKLNTIEQSQFPARKATPSFVFSRPKESYDYILEEAIWMSIDFRQELRWKLGVHKGIADCVVEKLKTMNFEKQFITSSSPEEAVEINRKLKDISKRLSSMVMSRFDEYKKQLMGSFPLIVPSAVKKDPSSSDQNSTAQDAVKKEEMDNPLTIDETIENVLAIPSSTFNIPEPSPSSSSISTSSAPSIFPPSTYFITQNNIDYDYLLKHQQVICKEIYRLNGLGYGSLIHGSSYSGKTVAVAYTLIGWIDIGSPPPIPAAKPTPTSKGRRTAQQKEREKEKEEERKVKELKQQQDQEAKGPATILIFALQKWILRWLLILQPVVGNCSNLCLWSYDSSDVSLGMKELNSITKNSKIILISVEEYSSFLSSSSFRAIANLQGIVVDLRGFSMKQQLIMNHNESSTDEGTFTEKRYEMLVRLSENLPLSLVNRIVLSDENFRSIDRYSTLSFLLPGVTIHDLIKKFSSNSNTEEKPAEVVASAPSSSLSVSFEQPPSINSTSNNSNKLSSTLNQLLINLSVHAVIPSELNTRAYAQIREETISTELSSSQQKKYDELALVLVKSGYYDGNDLDKFSRITILLKMICFHSSLVTVKKKVTISNSNNSNSQNPNEYTFLSYRPSASSSSSVSSTAVSSSFTKALSDNQLSSSVGGYANSNNSGFSNIGGVINNSNNSSSYMRGSLNTIGLSSQYMKSSDQQQQQQRNISNSSNTSNNPSVNHSTYFCQGPLLPKIYNGSFVTSITEESMLSEGSNKLKILKTLLHRFAGLRVVLVASNWIECHLIHHYLSLSNIDHLYPHYYLKKGKSLNPIRSSMSSSSSTFSSSAGGNGSHSLPFFSPSSSSNDLEGASYPGMVNHSGYSPLPSFSANSNPGNDPTTSLQQQQQQQQNPQSHISSIYEKMENTSFSNLYHDYFHLQDSCYWIGEENNIQLFNDQSVLSSILLTTHSAFKSPSMTPWLADAVILLSHEWDSYCEIRNCFRLRLLKSGPKGDPVTIIRVSSKNTIEDVMLRQKTGLPQLQGIKLSDLNLIQKASSSPSHHNSSSSSTSSSSGSVTHHGSSASSSSSSLSQHHTQHHHHSYSSFEGSSMSSSADFSHHNPSSSTDYGSSLITNLTFLRSIPLMHYPNKSSAGSTSGITTSQSAPSSLHTAYHSTPVSPLGASYDYRAPSPAIILPGSESSGIIGSDQSANEGTTGSHMPAPPPRRAGSLGGIGASSGMGGTIGGIVVVGPQGKTPVTSSASLSSSSWTTKSSLMGGHQQHHPVTFHDDTNIQYYSNHNNRPVSSTSSSTSSFLSAASTPSNSLKVDKVAVMKWLENYRYHLINCFMELLDPPSPTIVSDSSLSVEETSIQQQNTSSSTAVISSSSSVIPFIPSSSSSSTADYNLLLLFTIEKKILNSIYCLLYQRSKRMNNTFLGNVGNHNNNNTSDTGNEENSNDHYHSLLTFKRDYSHDISFFLYFYEIFFSYGDMAKSKPLLLSSLDRYHEKIFENHSILTENERLRLFNYGYGRGTNENKLLSYYLPLSTPSELSILNASKAIVTSSSMIVAPGELSIPPPPTTTTTGDTASMISSVLPDNTTNNHSTVLGTTGIGTGSGGTPSVSFAQQPQQIQRQSQQRSNVFQYFQEIFQESMRLGITSFEPWLYVNPLQMSSRYDTIKVPSYLHDLMNQEYHIKIKYMNANYRNTLAAAGLSTGVTGVMGIGKGDNEGVGTGGGTGSRGGGRGSSSKKPRASSTTSSVITSHTNLTGGNSSSMGGSGIGAGGEMIGDLMMKRDIIGGIPSSTMDGGGGNNNRSYLTQTIAPQVYDPNNMNYKRTYDSLQSGGSSNYYDQSGNSDNKRMKVGDSSYYNYNSSSYNQQQSSSENYGSSSLPLSQHTSIGGMIIPSTSSTSSSSTGGYSFDLTQPNKLLLSDNITPNTNANMFTSNMPYDESNPMRMNDNKGTNYYQSAPKISG
jgi:hypothetical protein